MISRSGAALFFFLTLLMIGCNIGRDNNPVLQILPGKYKVTVTRSGFGGGDARSSVTENCFNEVEFQPFKTRYENEYCKISKFDRIGSSVSYDIYCSADVTIGMTGTIAYGYENETIRWSIKAVGTNESKVYSFELDGEAVRLGECEDETINIF